MKRRLVSVPLLRSSDWFIGPTLQTGRA